MEIVQPGPTDFTQLVDTPSSFFSSANKAVTVNAGATALVFTPASSGGTWGSITGTLSSQTDLQAALDLKAPLASPTFSGNVVLPSATVSLGMMANMATSSLIYRKTAGSGVPEVNTLATLKTDLVLVKADVGLGSVDNTSDANKPVSTATQTALDAKQAALVSGTNIKTVNGNTLLGSGDLTVSGTTPDLVYSLRAPTSNQSTPDTGSLVLVNYLSMTGVLSSTWVGDSALYITQ